jgi:pimeloyl-ACP methyl ester carboxylesterase
MAYVEVGAGEPLLCIHGSLCDFRVWSSVLGLLTLHHRVITPGLRHFFPEHWDGLCGGFTIAQHVDDVIAFIEAMGGPANLLGHSRGGHISFRVAQKRPDLLRRVILAEPGGDLDQSLAPQGSTAPPPMRSHTVVAAEKIAAGDIDGGLESFLEAISSAGAWRTLPATVKQELRDNAITLLGQVNEQRQPFTRADAEAIRVPALFIGGSDTPGSLPVILRALAAHVPDARMEIISHAAHVMFEDDPVRFREIVTDFVDGGS